MKLDVKTWIWMVYELGTVPSGLTKVLPVVLDDLLLDPVLLLVWPDLKVFHPSHSTALDYQILNESFQIIVAEVDAGEGDLF